MLQLRAFRDLCTAPEDETPWPALNGGPDAPGPFERGWKRFWQEQRPLVLEAQKQQGNAESWSSMSLWNTKEMEKELEKFRDAYIEGDKTQELDEHGSPGASVRLSLLKEVAPGRLGELSRFWPFRSVQEDLLSVTEYNALQTLSIARNYDGIAHSQAEKPKRQIDRDVKIPEQPLYIEGADGAAWGGEGQGERLEDDRAGTLRRNVNLEHRFVQADLEDILTYKTAERTQAFVKELQVTGFMQNEELPPPAEETGIATRREYLTDRLLAPYEALVHVEAFLPDVIERQRSTFGSKKCPADEEEIDMDAPPDPDEPIPRPRDEGEAAARFAPSDSWRRPSDYVAFLAKKVRRRMDKPSQRKEGTPFSNARPSFIRRTVCSSL